MLISGTLLGIRQCTNGWLKSDHVLFYVIVWCYYVMLLCNVIMWCYYVCIINAYLLHVFQTDSNGSFEMKSNVCELKNTEYNVSLWFNFYSIARDV